MSTKSIQINAAVHNELKTFCSQSGLKLGHWVSKVIKEKLNDKAKK